MVNCDKICEVVLSSVPICLGLTIATNRFLCAWYAPRTAGIERENDGIETEKASVDG